MFDAYIGIDYSGAGDPDDHIPGLRVFRSERDEWPKQEFPKCNQMWSRRLLTESIQDWLSWPHSTIIGIDHAFSFPKKSLDDRGLVSWDNFLSYFRDTWHTDKKSVQEAIKQGAQIMGEPDLLRLTDQWTSSAKSVFNFKGPGQVGKSTHAGIPWLSYLRLNLGTQVHFWPFDGFNVPKGKSVVAEVYPALFKNRYRDPNFRGHELDAFAVCRWLQERDKLGFLARYFMPLLSPQEEETALVEGWILGIT